MKFKSLFLACIFILAGKNGFCQNDSLKVNKKRVFLVGGGFAAILGGSYWYLKQSWWSETQIPFHFDDGADLVYAKNVDKAGHFMGGLHSADMFSSSMQWAGMHQKQSLWYGALFGSGMQLAIELKDGYAPHWGFSKWDLATGSLGALWPVFQYYNDDLKAVKFKFSYYKHSEIYWNLERQRGKEINNVAWQDDYPNQTYWATFNINQLVQTCCWPEWLNLAIGFGLDDTQYLNENNTKKGGNNEWYISLDYNMSKILKNWNSKTGKKVKIWLDYIHFPAPTIRIFPKLEFYPVFI